MGFGFDALVIGMVSAVSLPLGAVTAMFWRPGDRVIAGLMAFGGGALLAALAIDLVAKTVFEHEELFIWLGGGCVVGGVLFQGLNQLLNKRGGFLRKTSTTLFYLQRMNRSRVMKALRSMGRVELFNGLPEGELRTVAGLMEQLTFREGYCLYEVGDPGRYVYFILDGSVNLYEEGDRGKVYKTVGVQNAVGRMAFLTGKPYGTSAVAAEEVTVLRLAYEDLARFVDELPKFQEEWVDFLGSEKVIQYLGQRHGLDEDAAVEWLEKRVLHFYQTVSSGYRREDLLHEEFIQGVRRVRRFGLFRELSDDDVELLSTVVFEVEVDEGDVLFTVGEEADRMFVVVDGAVSLVKSSEDKQKPVRLEARDAVGGMGFLTGVRHSATAVVTEASRLWVIKREDFNRLLMESDTFYETVRHYLREEKEMEDYLERRQHLDVDKVSRWTQKALGQLATRRVLPVAADLTNTVKVGGHGVPMAIWLGILLDGVPESVVIGAHVDESGLVSMSLIGGIFLANYPEALSSSVGMQHQGFSRLKTFWMWLSLMVMTGVGAMLGRFFVEMVPHAWMVGIQGVAAGAMLAMIAETMLPEAYHKGGEIVGLATIAGFLVAISLKVMW